jgi:hypothetical protein
LARLWLRAVIQEVHYASSSSSVSAGTSAAPPCG